VLSSCLQGSELAEIAVSPALSRSESVESVVLPSLDLRDVLVVDSTSIPCCLYALFWLSKCFQLGADGTRLLRGGPTLDSACL
jgi:hypothetical protein